jgi:hypothetical protein
VAAGKGGSNYFSINSAEIGLEEFLGFILNFMIYLYLYIYGVRLLNEKDKTIS